MMASVVSAGGSRTWEPATSSRLSSRGTRWPDRGMTRLDLTGPSRAVSAVSGTEFTKSLFSPVGKRLARGQVRSPLALQQERVTDAIPHIIVYRAGALDDRIQIVRQHALVPVLVAVSHYSQESSGRS